MENFNTKEYYTDFSALPFSTVLSFDNPDDQLAMQNKLILDCIDCHAPLKRKFTRPPAPWMKQLDIIELQKQRDKYRFLAHNIPSKGNCTNFRNVRNKLTKKIKGTKILTPKNSKEIWKIVHRIFHPNNKTLEADTNELNKYFNQTGKCLTTTKPHSNDELKNLIGTFTGKNNGFQLQTVSYEDVDQCLRPLRNDCSTGYENIPTMFIKPIAGLLVSPLTFVINNDIATKNFPDAWKTARINPIPTTTQPVELKDYRPLFNFACSFKSL